MDEDGGEGEEEEEEHGHLSDIQDLTPNNQHRLLDMKVLKSWGTPTRLCTNEKPHIGSTSWF